MADPRAMARNGAPFRSALWPHAHGMAWRASGALLLLAALGACTGGSGDAFDRRTTHLFQASYENIAQRYVEPVAVDQVALAGLAGISSIDPTVQVARAGNAVSLRTRTTVTTFNAPSSADARGWAALTTSMVKTGRMQSERLQNADDDTVYQALFDSAVKTLDQNTRYLGPAKAKEERARRVGFGGVGIQLHAVGDTIEVLSVVPDSPAAAANIRPRDRLLRIGDKLVHGMNVSEVVDRVRGPIGARIDLEFQRPDAPAPLSYRLTREKIVPQSVFARSEGRHLEIKIGPQFNEQTAKTLQQQVAEIRRRMGPALSGIVIDLRDNGGGLLDQAVRSADLFLRKGIIASARGRHPESVQSFGASGDDVSGGLPIVVLVNGGTASAAEVMAAALQDNGRAVIVGTGTYGKGTVQLISDLPNDGEFMLTWSRLHAPSGYALHRLGVPPTICTSGGIETVARAVDGLRVRASEIEARMARWHAQVFPDPETSERLRNTCPAEKVVRAVDLDIARALLDDATAYRQAVGLTKSQIARTED